MKVKLEKLGNDLIFTFPNEIASKYELNEGDELLLNETVDGVFVVKSGEGVKEKRTTDILNGMVGFTKDSKISIEESRDWKRINGLNPAQKDDKIYKCVFAGDQSKLIWKKDVDSALDEAKNLEKDYGLLLNMFEVNRAGDILEKVY